MNDAYEYLPTENDKEHAESRNGHTKIFQLKPALDPITKAIIESRERAARDKRLTRSMVSFYVEILDRAFDPQYYMPHPKGVLTMSDTVLAEVFRVSNRTIYTWKTTVAACEDYFWLTQQFRKNMWPITTYHLCCLHSPPRTKTDRDGTYGSAGVGRPPPMNPGLGARKPGQPGLPLPGSRKRPPRKSDLAQNAQVLAISGLTGNPLPVSAEANFGSEPKPASGESRNPLRARAEANFGSEPKPISGESRNPLRARAEADCRLIRVSEGEEEPLETPFKRSTGDDRLKRKGGEDVFLLEVGATLTLWAPRAAATEMKEWGGWWRNRYRECPDKAWAVLAEIGSAIKEGTVKEHAGKMASDLWKRWPAPLTKAS